MCKCSKCGMLSVDIWIWIWCERVFQYGLKHLQRCRLYWPHQWGQLFPLQTSGNFAWEISPWPQRLWMLSSERAFLLFMHTKSGVGEIFQLRDVRNWNTRKPLPLKAVALWKSWPRQMVGHQGVAWGVHVHPSLACIASVLYRPSHIAAFLG